MKSYYLFLVIILITTISCKKNNKNNIQTSTFSLLENVSDSAIQLFDEIEYTTLETTDQSLFGAIDKLIVDDDFFFILDKAMKKKIFVFAKDGSFIRTIGNIGKGPGEYTNIEDFTIDEVTKNVIVLCFPSTIIIYNPKGQFISQTKLTPSALLWNICNYKDGYLLSANHQSVLTGDEAFLVFNYDKNFNLREKILNVLPSYITMPPFISNPLQNIENKIVYFDSFTSNIYFNINHADFKIIHLDFGGKEVPLSSYANPQEFFSHQREYRFFLETMIADNVLYTSFANCGERYVAIINLKTNKKSTFKNFIWFPDKLLFNKDNYFYSSSSALSIIKDHDISYTKKIMNYPLEANSNPIVLTFKAKALPK
jgi:hypothetical protein